MNGVFTKMNVCCVYVQMMCVDGVRCVLRVTVRGNVFSRKVCARRGAYVQTVRAIGPDGPSDVEGREPVVG